MEKELKKYIFILFVVILLFYSYTIVKDFVTLFLSSLVLSYLFLPLHKKMSKKINPYLSAFLCILVIFILTGTFVFYLGQITYTQIKEVAKQGDIENLVYSIKETIKNKNIPYTQEITSSLENILDISLSYLGSVLLGIIKGIINIFFLLFISYFVLIYWDDISKKFYEIFPFENKKKLFEDIRKTTDGIIKSSLLIAIIEGIISYLFFYFMGIKYALFLSFVIVFLAFIPFFGPAVVWIPITAFNLLKGDYITVIYFIIYGVIVSYLIDFLLRNILYAEQTKTNPVIILIGIVGGIKIFGFIGIFLGPIILTMTLKIIFYNKSN